MAHSPCDAAGFSLGMPNPAAVAGPCFACRHVHIAPGGLIRLLVCVLACGLGICVVGMVSSAIRSQHTAFLAASGVPALLSHVVPCVHLTNVMCCQ
jgi:hypothetical protein